MCAKNEHAIDTNLTRFQVVEIKHRRYRHAFIPVVFYIIVQ